MRTLLRAIALTAAIAALSACGEPAPQIATVVRMDGLMEDEVDSVSIWVFGPKRSDGILVNCQSLMNETIQPTDTRLELLAQASLDFDTDTSRNIELEVDSGQGRVVYIRALGNDDLVGSGCEEDIEVRGGETTNVEVVVYGPRS